jgi:hypothetical protein
VQRGRRGEVGVAGSPAAAATAVAAGGVQHSSGGFQAPGGRVLATTQAAAERSQRRSRATNRDTRAYKVTLFYSKAYSSIMSRPDELRLACSC